MKFDRLTYFIGAIIAIGLAVALRIDAPQAEAAFGVSPPWVKNDHMLPGTTYEQIVKLSRSDLGRDMRVTVRVDGDKEIKKWLKIENENNLLIKKGEKILPMKVSIKVPRRAAIRDYKGGIFVTLESIPDEVAIQGGTVAIKLGAHILVALSVIGEKVTDYKIKSINLDPLSQGDDFYLGLNIENLGNTEISKIDGQIDIYDKEEKNILKSFIFKDFEEVISPDSVKKSKIVYYGVKLDPGEYWVVVKAYKDGEIAYENRLFQKVDDKVVPVITAEDVGVKKPSIPKSDEMEIEGEIEADEVAVSAEAELKKAAPLVSQENKIFIIFGLVGLIFGLAALAAIIILLVVLIRNQRHATIQHYLTQQTPTNNDK